jgi:hypothetical protein
MVNGFRQMIFAGFSLPVLEQVADQSELKRRHQPIAVYTDYMNRGDRGFRFRFRHCSDAPFDKMPFFKGRGNQTGRTGLLPWSTSPMLFKVFRQTHFSYPSEMFSAWPQCRELVEHSLVPMYS